MPFIPTSSKPTAGFIPTTSKPTPGFISSKATTKRDTRPLQDVLAEGEKAKEFLAKPWYGQLFTKEFVSEFLKETPKTLTRLFATIKETPELLKEKKLMDVLSPFVSPSELAQKEGKVIPSQEKYDVPFVKDEQVKSFYSQFANISEEIMKEARGEAEPPEVLGVKIPWQARLYAPLVEATVGLLEAKELVSIGFNVVKGVRTYLSKEQRLKEIMSKLQMIQPRRTPTQVDDLARQGLLKLDDKGMQVIIPTPHEKRIASEADDVLKVGNKLSQNITAISDKINKMSDGIRDYLSKHKIDVDKNAIMDKIDEIKPKEWMKSEASIEKSYNLVKNWVAKQLQGAGDDLDGGQLWEFRKHLDDLFETQFGSKAWDMDKANTARETYGQARKIIDKYVAEKIGDTEFLELIDRLHLNYDAIDNLSTWSRTVVNKKAVELWWKNHPKILKALKTAGGVTRTVGTAVGLNALYRALRGKF